MTVSEWRSIIARDIAANKGYPKSVVILLALRTAQFVRSQPGLLARIAYLPVGSVYKLLSEWILGVEIPASTQIGAGLQIRHGVGIVLNPFSVIGEDVMLRHGVTLGNRLADDDCPVIGDGVEFGAGATVIGRVTIGDHARIGAGAVVVKDVPAGGVAYAPPTVIRG
ncbi:putative serine acetyltransferase [metagenome]|uniref:Putative serine acetyltransferase n=1 Tax=metagenome TaxID=256318 RepID=A0A2P2BZC1_9ZZZZ